MTTTKRTHRLAVLTALAVAACGATACSDSSGSPSTGAAHGGTSTKPAADPGPPSATNAVATAPLTLRLGTDDGPDMPGAQQVKQFAQQVADLSGGSITIEPVWHADDGQPHWDQYVAGMLMKGQLDLAMVPSRAWDDVGVQSLRAVTAPFLVTTDTLTAAIVSDRTLTDQLTSGLANVGVSALGLYPEGLRHPFGFDGVLGGASDYRGGVVRAAWSRTTQDMFEALGATTTDEEPDTSSMLGAESSYRLTPAGVATGNVSFYPKVNVLAIGDAARDALNEDQAALLQQAADATRAWVLDTLPADAEAAATFCQEAGRIGSASQAEIDSLVAATRPVFAELRKDPTTATLLDEIEDLAKTDPAPEPVTGCPTEVSSGQSLANGTYTFTMTADQARAAGVSDQGMIDENAGAYVIHLADGTWELDQVYTSGPKTGTTFHSNGGYQVTGRRLKWFWGHEPGAWTEVDVTVAADGSLDFNGVHDGGDAQAQALSEAFYTHWEPEEH